MKVSEANSYNCNPTRTVLKELAAGKEIELRSRNEEEKMGLE